MLVDMTNDKRYTYPLHVYIYQFDSSVSFKRHPPVTKKGSSFLHIAIPYINQFYLVPEGEPSKSNAGFWGLSAGVDYYYGSGRYVSIKASVATDYPVPVPAGVDFSGEHESMTSAYITFSNAYRIKQFSIGYGIALSKNTWKFIYDDRFNPPPPTRAPAIKTRTTAGFTFPVQYHIGNKFVLGLNYMPFLFQLTDGMNLRHEYLISLDFGWKISLSSQYKQ